MTKNQVSKYNRVLILVLFVALIVCIVAFLLLGVNTKILPYALRIRVPKVIAMIVVACCLGPATLIFQTITNNRVLTPSVLGLTSLYLVAQTVIVFALGTTSTLVVNRSYNFIFSLALMSLVSLLLYRIMFNKNSGNLFFILLTGTVMGQFFSSISSFLQRMIDPNEFLALQNKMFASFRNINTDILVISICGVLLLFTVSYRELRNLDVIALGREHAINLGIDYDPMVKKLIIIVTLLVGIATALIGPITFLGFIVTNITRQIFKTYKHSYLLIGTILLGGITLAGGQALIEHVFSFTTTLSVIINLVGGIYFIGMLLYQSKNSN